MGFILFFLLTFAAGFIKDSYLLCHIHHQSTPLWPFSLRGKHFICKLKCEMFFYPFSVHIIPTQQGEETALLLGGLGYEGYL